MQAGYYTGEAVDIGTDVQLFPDDSSFEDRWDLERQYNIPVKHEGNRVIIADRPWEQNIGGPSVLYDEEEGIFCMWYALFDPAAYGYQYGTSRWDPKLHGYPYMISYAESEDGLSWKKPLLKQFPYRGFERTNIVLTGKKKAQGFRFPDNPQGMGLVRIKRDRFAGLYAGTSGGFLLSRELLAGGNRLLLNCASLHGAFLRKEGVRPEIKVEILDADDLTVPGFSFQDCENINMDDMSHRVTWKGKTDISAIRGKRIYLRFFLRSAHLFSFRFAD